MEGLILACDTKQPLSLEAKQALEACEQALGPAGRLSTALPGFVPRSQQLTLAQAVTKTILEAGILIAEAGTGTGKTFAYLVPCLLSGKKTIISTATKTLQDQLFHKDVPMLLKALGLGLRIQNLKGRANYLCRHRILLHTQERRFSHPNTVKDLIYLSEKLPQLCEGERSELPEISEDSEVWPFVTSTVDNCLGGECAHYHNCFLTKARRRAMEADVVIINHYLFFADSRLKDEGFGELLPSASVIVFDEAHQLPEIAENFNSTRLGTRQLRDLMDDLLNEWPILDLANQPLKALSFATNEIIEDLLQACMAREERLIFREVQYLPKFQQAWERLADLLAQLHHCLNGADLDAQPGLKNCLQRLEAFQVQQQKFAGNDVTLILWVERFKQSLVFHATPLDSALAFKKLLTTGQCAYVFTSATLTMAEDFACFTKPLGLEAAPTLMLHSPFRYQDQALLYLPRSLPDPSHPAYYEQLLSRAKPLIDACGGRTFFLFTSHRALQLVAGLLREDLAYPLLVQGEEAKPILLARFRALGNAVLLGTDTFWEGVDVKGAALSCVIIDKLPFLSPNDPIVRGKMAYFKSQRLSGFDEYLLPQAVLALKQGCGRLIRDATDKGVIMLADPRLTSREYGRLIFASLPKIQKTRDEAIVLNFIQQLVLT